MSCSSCGEAIDATQQPVYLFVPPHPPHVHVRLPAKPGHRGSGCAGAVLLLVVLIVFLIARWR